MCYALPMIEAHAHSSVHTHALAARGENGTGVCSTSSTGLDTSVKPATQRSEEMSAATAKTNGNTTPQSFETNAVTLNNAVANAGAAIQAAQYKGLDAVAATVIVDMLYRADAPDAKTAESRTLQVATGHSKKSDARKAARGPARWAEIAHKVSGSFVEASWFQVEQAASLEDLHADIRLYLTTHFGSVDEIAAAFNSGGKSNTKKASDPVTDGLKALEKASGDQVAALLRTALAAAVREGVSIPEAPDFKTHVDALAAEASTDPITGATDPKALDKARRDALADIAGVDRPDK